MRDPEPVADLHHLAAGHDDLSSGGQSEGDKREGAGTVVDDMDGAGVWHGRGQR